MLYLPPSLFALAVATSHRRQNTHIRDIDTNALVRLFLGGFFPGVILAMLAETVLTVAGLGVFLALDHGDILGQIQQYRAQHPPPANATLNVGDVLSHIHIRHSLSVLLGMAFMAFVVAGAVEESIKTWLVLRGPCFIRPSTWSHGATSSTLSVNPPTDAAAATPPFHFVLSFAAVGCGFATIENVSYAFLTPTLALQIWAAAVRGLLATPLHMICATLTGMQLVLLPPTTSTSKLLSRRVGRAMLPGIVLHGAYDLQSFLFTFWLNDDDNIMSFGASALCLVVGGLYLNYLRGHIHWTDNYHPVGLVDDDSASMLV
ncbi:hypothetical protein DYB30_007324 [Aphanomyces astaci]|uniref:Uncharacterized protein n=1 Tax=Aphanomyces astaci TaxID=112090 RepID=A0A397E1X4_APHAT|nr:hypothetical protein AaE_013743 [Aphanomyces astaci]RHY47085.1 hypothetical protein DYB34_010334 [Aphanomyces astaci]RHY71191.1 hypothetical protein DYB30_007324 [Aphanomyces astaci]RHZ19721.1 hypothetical protein DYB31_009439 [Aphanomyces astaci]